MTRMSKVGWPEVRIKMVTDKIGSGKTPTGGSEAYVDNGIVFIRSQNIHFDGIRLNDIVFIDDQTDWWMRSTRTRENDSLLNITGASIGRASRVVAGVPRANVNQHVCILRPSQYFDARFLTWCLVGHGVQDQIKALQVGGNRDGLNFEQVGNLVIPRPPVDEQRRIADFLDHEVARIGRLDWLAGSALGLLSERRRAVIERTLMNFEFAPQKLFRCLRVLRDGTHQPPARTDLGVPLLTARNVSSGTLRLTNLDTCVSEKDAVILEGSLKPLNGDVLISVKGTVGAVGIVPPDFPRAVLDRNLALLRPYSFILSGWLLWVLRTRNLQEQMRLGVVAAAQPGLPLGAIRELRIPTVGLESQEEQLREIDSADARIKELEAAIDLQRHLLAERRQALITAAVTGQIDVTTARGIQV